MVRSHVFGWITIILCFVSCLYAQATVSKEQASKKVKDAQQSALSALTIAKYELKEAENVKENMEWRNKKAETALREAEAVVEASERAVKAAKDAVTAATEAKTAAPPQKKAAARTAETAAKKEESNQKSKRTNAKTVVENLNNKMKQVRKLYPNAKSNTDTAINLMKDILSKARELDHKAEIEILPDTGSPNDYANVTQSALSVKSQAKELEKQIENAKKNLSAAKDIIWIMPAVTGKEQIEKYKADGIIVGSEFDTILSETDNVIQSVKEKRNNVLASLKPIKNLLTNSPQKLNQRISGSITKAQGELKKVSKIFIEVREEKNTIQKWKKHAEDSKKYLTVATAETDARRELRNIKFYAGSADMVLDKIKKALKAAEKSAESAIQQYQSAIEEIKQDSTTLNGNDEALTEKSTKIEENDAVIPKQQEEEQKTENEQQTSTEEATPILERQEPKRQTDQQKEEQVEETTAKPTNNDAVQPINQQQPKSAEEETTKPASKATKVHTKSQSVQSAEEMNTKPTSKTSEEKTNNQSDQLTEEQIAKTTNKAAEEQTKRKPEQSSELDTEPPQKDATVKSTIINSEKALTNTSQNSAHQASGSQGMEKTVQPKDQKSEILHLDKLRKGKKNITKVPFFGENVPASGAWSDGSLIVSVPLLVALIASAVLH